MCCHPRTALQIINHLNSRSGEGESRVSGWIEMHRTAPTTAAMPESPEDEADGGRSGPIPPQSWC